MQKLKKYIVEIILFGLLIGSILLGIEILKDYENRLTKLETKFELCVDCSKRTNQIGNYTYKTYKGIYSDENGKLLLETDIDILSEQFRWKCGSIDKVVRGNEIVNLAKVIREYNNDAELKDVKGIVCIGTASAEGEIKGEETRAKDRVETLINLVSSNLNSNYKVPIYGFNFGKYNTKMNESCSNATIDQRRVVLLKIIKQSNEITNKKLEIALKKILLEKASDPYLHFPIDIRDYSMFTSKQNMLIYGRK